MTYFFSSLQEDVIPLKLLARQRFAARRQMVKEFCVQHMEWTKLHEITLDVARWRRYMWHDTRDKFSWCGIAKVGETFVSIRKAKLNIYLSHIIRLVLRLGPST